MRSVLDTNLIVSAILVRGGIEDRILRSWREHQFELVLSPDILSELARVLFYDKFAKKRWMSEKDIQFLLETLANESLLVEGKNRIFVCRDPSENKFIEAAIEAEAQYIVTGDNDLLDLKSYQGVKIIKPAAFLKLLG